MGEQDRGQAEGRLMIIAAHAPIGAVPPTSPVGWYAAAAITEPELIAKLHTYPNLIAWIAGHRHCNAITAFASPDASHPELGFWQIETSSLRDFPQQFRTFGIVRVSDGALSILAADFNPDVAEGSPAATSRAYAVAVQQIFQNPRGYPLHRFVQRGACHSLESGHTGEARQRRRARAFLTALRGGWPQTPIDNKPGGRPPASIGNYHGPRH